MFLLLVLIAWPAHGDDCDDCHDADLGLESRYATTFEWSRFIDGAHAELDCSECHLGDYRDVPHVIETTVSCSECHDFEIIEDEVEASVHFFRCAFCHDPHAPKGLDSDTPMRERVETGNTICRQCHEDADRWAQMTGSDQGPADLTEVHDWLPRMEKHKKIVLCVCCHTPSDQPGVHNIRPAAEAQRRCETCHHRDSLIATRLYGDPQRETWITNDVLLGDAYVKGAMRNVLVDGLFILAIVLALLGIGVHAGLRVAASKRNPSNAGTVEKHYVYDRWVRSWHWINALLFVVLGITGFRIHFGGRQEPLLSFETAFHIHNLVGFLMALWFVWFLVSGKITRNDRSFIKPPANWFKGIMLQARFYLLGVFRGDPHPFHTTRERRFNPLQQVVYLVVMYGIFMFLVVTGLLLLYPEYLPETIVGRPAGWVVATAHYLFSVALVLFLVVHLYLITLGDKPGHGLKSMIDGNHRQSRHGGE